MGKIMKIAKKRNIHVRRCSEALLSKFKNKYLGTSKNFFVSLTASKTITTGQGGYKKIILCFYKKIKLLKNQGILGKSDGGNVKA